MGATLEGLMNSLNFAWRQKDAVYRAVDCIQQLLTFKVPFTKIFATVIAVFQLFSAAVLDTPRPVMGEELDLSGYELVFEDDFSGNSLDMNKWHIRNYGESRIGYYDDSQLAVRDGNLVITGRYLENGTYGDGWYTSAIETNEKFCGGYFEMRAILNKCALQGTDFWSCFWISASGVYDPAVSKGGPGGCELDIVESFGGGFLNPKNNSSFTPALWCNGVDSDDNDDCDGRNFGKYYIPNAYTQYNTYGFKWTKDEYIWYVNGVEAVRNSWKDGAVRTPFGKGASCVPEEVIVSMSIPSRMTATRTEPAEYVIDYVRIYQNPAEAPVQLNP